MPNGDTRVSCALTENGGYFVAGTGEVYVRDKCNRDRNCAGYTVSLDGGPTYKLRSDITGRNNTGNPGRYQCVGKVDRVNINGAPGLSYDQVISPESDRSFHCG